MSLVNTNTLTLLFVTILVVISVQLGTFTTIHLFVLVIKQMIITDSTKLNNLQIHNNFFIYMELTFTDECWLQFLCS